MCGINPHLCNGRDVMNRTSSLLKSVLRYVLDKNFDLETTFTQSCFPNKETDSRWRVKQLIFLMTKMLRDDLILILTVSSV